MAKQIMKIKYNSLFRSMCKMWEQRGQNKGRGEVVCCLLTCLPLALHHVFSVRVLSIKGQKWFLKKKKKRKKKPLLFIVKARVYIQYINYILYICSIKFLVGEGEQLVGKISLKGSLRE